MVGAAFGISPTCSVECAAGITAGGRTGLSSLVAAILFFAFTYSLAFFPCNSHVCYGTCIGRSGLFDDGCSFGVDFNDMTEGIPAFLCAISMPLRIALLRAYI